MLMLLILAVFLAMSLAAVTYTHGGTIEHRLNLNRTGSGDYSSSESVNETDLIQIQNSGGSDPDMDGFLNGDLTFPDTDPHDILLAAASDPLGVLGDAGYSSGFVPGTTHKVKYIEIVNTGSVGTITVVSKATVGAPLFAALGDGVVLQPNGGFIKLYVPPGTAALTTTTNDALTLTASDEAATGRIAVVYGL